MPTAENAKLEYEAGQNAVAMIALSDSGDGTLFESADSLWSKRSGSEPIVRPDGLVSGGVVIPAVLAGDDDVDVSSISCYLAGVLTAVSAAADTVIARAATDVACIESITVTSAGAIAVVKGTDSADTSFSETRDTAGGPPLIPVGSIEIAQVRTTSNVAGPILASEIFAVVGTHTERYDFPLFEMKTDLGSVVFYSANPSIHTGSIPKGVFAQYSSPIFAEVGLASDFVPPETSHSVSSEQVYGAVLGSSSKSLNQGTFIAKTQDGITDALVTLKDENLWFRFYQDKYKTPHILCQGSLGITRTFPAGSSIQASCTISAESTAIEKAS